MSEKLGYGGNEDLVDSVIEETEDLAPPPADDTKAVNEYVDRRGREKRIRLNEYVGHIVDKIDPTMERPGNTQVAPDNDVSDTPNRAEKPPTDTI